MGFESLLQQGLQNNLTMATQNPGIEAFGRLVNEALAQKEGTRVATEKAGIEDVSNARQAAYSEFPTMAAERGGLTVTPEQIANSKTSLAKTPSWGQEQKVASIKSGILRGEVVIGKEFGEPQTYKILTTQDGLRAIMDAGLDPALFTQELQSISTKISEDDLIRLRPKNISKNDWKNATREQQIEFLQATGVM